MQTSTLPAFGVDPPASLTLPVVQLALEVLATVKENDQSTDVMIGKSYIHI